MYKRSELVINNKNSDRPLITVLIPTYNRRSLVQEAVASVIAQTYTSWELIVVDDGSNDGTVEAIRNIGDPRIDVVTLTHTGHIGNVFNAGAKKGKGEWLAFLGSDDIWMPRNLETQLEVLKKDNKRWVYGGYELMDENKKTIYRDTAKFIPLSGWIVKEIILTKTGVTLCSLIVEKKLFDEIGGFCTDPRLLYRGDYELTLRMAMKAEAAFTPDVVVRVREHAGRITKSLTDPYERSALAYEIFISQKPGREFEKLARRQMAFQLSEASVHRFAKGKNKMALKQLGRALFLGDRTRHWLSALKRGIYAICKKHSGHSAKKGKASDIATHTA